MPGRFSQAVNKCMFYVDTTRLFFFFPHSGAVCHLHMTHVSYKVGRSDDAMMRARRRACLTRGRSEVSGRRAAPSHSRRLGGIAALEDARRLRLIGNVGFRRGELVSKDKSKFRVAIQLNIQRNSPLDLPFGCVSFIAAENEIKAFSFVYLFVHNFALLRYEDSTASPWFGCFLFHKKKKHSVCQTILITFSKFGMTETVSECLQAARPHQRKRAQIPRRSE